MINFKIIGKPSVWANGELEVEWRKAVANKLKGKTFDYSDDSLFEVEIKFFLPNNTAKRADLDNLAKPIIDTIFDVSKSETYKKLTGKLIDLDDSKIHKLILEKEKVDNNFRAEVTINTI